MDQSVEEFIDKIEPHNRAQAKELWSDLKAYLPDAAGTTRSHQAWPYGYRDHIREVMNIACMLHERLNRERKLPFTLGSALLVMFLHDCEKPFRHASDKQLSNFLWVKERPKKSDKHFQRGLYARYGFALSEEELNALTYVEGENNDYREGQRVMGPLAAFCHTCDVIPARIWFDYPRR